MLEQIPTLGARFDLDKVGTEQNCWQVFWRAVTPDSIPGTTLYEGGIHGGDYCIAIQSANPTLLEHVRSSLLRSQEFCDVSLNPRFIEGEEASALGLPRTGRIDSDGNLIGDDRRLLEQDVTTSMPFADQEVSLDVVESASTQRTKPASSRTGDLPELQSFREVHDLLKKRFVYYQPGFDRDIWITPQELCDVVEHFASLLQVGISTQSSQRSENALRIRLFTADGSSEPAIELEGMYMFKSRHALTIFLQSFNGSPRYADAIPDLAGILGRFQLHFTEPSGKEEPDYTLETMIGTHELWGKLLSIREGFGDELNRAVDALRRRREIDAGASLRQDQIRSEDEGAEAEPSAGPTEEQIQELKRRREEEKLREEAEIERRRQEVELETATQERRRSESRCIFCGKPLGFADKLKKLDRHKDCWEYVAD